MRDVQIARIRRLSVGSVDIVGHNVGLLIWQDSFTAGRWWVNGPSPDYSAANLTASSRDHPFRDAPALFKRLTRLTGRRFDREEAPNREGKVC